MEFKEALRQWRERARVSQRDVAMGIGMEKLSGGYIGKVERGLNVPKEETKQRIVEFFGVVSVSAFCEGPSPSLSPSLSTSEISPMEATVPVFKQNSLAPDWSNCGEKITELHVLAPGRNLVGVIVQTSSMYPKIPRGSIVMVDKTITTPEEGKIGMFWANGRAVIRRLAYAAAGVASLQALDPEVAPIEIPVGLLICMGVVYRVIADPNG